MPEIKISIIKDSVSIESDDLYYANIRDSGSGLKGNEELKGREEEINSLCAGISELIYQLQDVLRR